MSSSFGFSDFWMSVPSSLSPLFAVISTQLPMTSFSGGLCICGISEVMLGTSFSHYVLILTEGLVLTGFDKRLLRQPIMILKHWVMQLFVILISTVDQCVIQGDAEFSTKENSWQSSEPLSMLHMVHPIVWFRLSFFSSVSFATLVYWLLHILGNGGKIYSCFNFSQES